LTAAARKSILLGVAAAIVGATPRNFADRTKEMRMPVLLVAHDLHKPGVDYAAFHQAVKNYPCAKLAPSAYAVETDKTPQQMYEELRQFMDAGDDIYIVALAASHFGYGPASVTQWLEKYLPQR
jgi:hypothetical protein